MKDNNITDLLYVHINMEASDSCRNNVLTISFFKLLMLFNNIWFKHIFNVEICITNNESKF